MPDVFTRATVDETRLVPTGGRIGTFIEYPMFLGVRDYSALDEHLSQLIVYVQPADGGRPQPIEVELLRPGSDAPIQLVSDADRPVDAEADFAAARFVAPDTRVVGTQLLAGGVAAARRRPSFGVSVGRPGIGIDGGVVVGPTEPLPPPEPDPFRYRHRFVDGDPTGDWKLRIKNVGNGADLRRILILRPHQQIGVREARIPRAIFDRLLAKALTLADPSIVIGREAVLSFGQEFTELTGLGRLAFPVGKFEIPYLGNDVRIRDIQLEELDIGIARRTDSPVAIEFRLEFETGGDTELDVNLAPDIDIRRLNLSGRLTFDGPAPPYHERHDLAGEVIEARAPSGGLTLDVDPVDLDTSSFEGRVRKRIDGKLRDFKFSSSTKAALSSMSEYVTDALMFAAVGNESHLFHDVETTDAHIVVQHYPRPDNRLERLVEVANPTRVLSHEIVRAMDEPPRPLISTPTSTPVRSGTSRSPVRVRASLPAGRAPELLLTEPVTGSPVPSTSGIEHIVVLMLENRSFDHMLGYLTLTKGRDDVDGVPAHGRFRNAVPGTGGTQTHTTFTITDPQAVVVDPSHSVGGTAEQLAGGAMSGFVSSYFRKESIKADPGSEALVMGIYDENVLEVFDQLAEEFLVCDRWFCSHPGPTYPNRFIALQGSAPSVENFALDSGEPGTVEATNVFDVLTSAGVSWNVVESNISFLRMYDKYRIEDDLIVQRAEWLDMARSGRLPHVSWIEPHYGDLELHGAADDDHPPSDVRRGQQGVAEVYDALTSDPAQWAKTMLVITYDEHGGFHDHVPPVGLDGTSLDPSLRIHPDGKDHYGPRVPGLIVSPRVPRGEATHTVYDHTSILRTILDNFAPQLVGTGALGARVDAANSLLGELTEIALTRADRPILAAPHIEREQRRRSSEPFEADSFHLGMRLFPFGPKLRREVARRLRA